VNCVILEEALNIFHEAGIERLREKALILTGYLEFLLESSCQAGSVRIVTSHNPAERGSQLSLLFTNDIDGINERLHKAGVIVDVRRPYVIRASPVPLYNSFADVWEFVNIIRSVLEAK
jgi:kynureninase